MSAVLAAAFFDAPGLLAVRFRGHAADTFDAAAWSGQRHADAPSPASALIKVGQIAVGLTLGMLLLPMCAERTGTAPVAYDVRHQKDWIQARSDLVARLGPHRQDLQPYVVRTLLDLPRELTAQDGQGPSWLAPRWTAQDGVAHGQAERLGRDMDLREAGRHLAIILDLPGPRTIAAGAALARWCDPVPTFDNLPHPEGLVPSQDTLAAALAWASTYDDQGRNRPAECPALFLLEGERLRTQDNQPGRFDNRSHARLPSAGMFQELGIDQVVYVREHAGDVAERDDLNELFVRLAAAGIAVRHVGLDAYAAPAAPGGTASTTGAPGHGSAGASTVFRASRLFWPRSSLPDDAYQTRPRSLPPEPPGTYDGGLARRDAVIARLTTPPDAASSGGSWGRSSSSSSSG